MSNTNDMDSDRISGVEEKKRRPRSMTLMNIQWWAERIRKAEEVCRQIKEGTYSVDPQKVAKSIISK